MIDVNLLQLEIDKSGLKLDKIADELMIDRSTLYRKINNIGRGFTVAEMQKLVWLLDIPSESASKIFFKC